MGKRTGKSANSGRTHSGQAMVEFAFTSLMLLILLAGTIDLGRGVFQRAMLSNAVREAARYGSLHAADEPGMLAVAQSRVPSLGLNVSHFTATTAYDRITCATRALDGTGQIIWVARTCDTARTRDRLSICASYPFAMISTRLVGLDTLTMRECTTVGVQ